MKKQTSDNRPTPMGWEVQAHNAITAALELASLTADAIVARSNDPSTYFTYLWSRHRNLPGHHKGIAQRRISVPGSENLWHTACGLSSGKRVKIVGSGHLNLPFYEHQNQPLVALWLGDEAPPIQYGAPYVLLNANTIQQLVDLSLIATRLAESLLLPVIVYWPQAAAHLELQPIQWPTREFLDEFLGCADEIIRTPLAYQQAFWGEKRQRVPSQYPDVFKMPEEDVVWQTFQTIAREFAAYTDRNYPLLQISHFNESGGVLSLQNIAMEGVTGIQPILLNPLPWRELANRVRGMEWLAVVVPSGNNIQLRMLTEIALDLAFARSGEGIIYTRQADRPRVITLPASAHPIDWPATVATIQQQFKKTTTIAPVTNTEMPSKVGEAAHFQVGILLPGGLTIVRELARWFYQLTGWRFRIAGDPLKSFFAIAFHLDKIPQAGDKNDVLLIPDLQLNIEESLQTLRPKSVLVLPGHPEAPELTWQQLAEDVRSAILENEFQLLLTNLEMVVGDRWDEVAVTGVLLASLVKALHHLGAKVVSPLPQLSNSPQHNNCHSNMAEVYAQALETIRVVDTQLVARYTPPLLEKTEPILHWPEVTHVQTLEPHHYKEYLAFHLTGHYLNCQKVPFRTGGLVHPLLLPYRELEKFRYNFPVCLMEDVAQPVRPLKEVIDEIIREAELDGEAQAQFEHDLLWVEKEIKQLVSRGYQKPLHELWEMAVAGILHDVGADKEKAAQMAENYIRARHLLPEGVQVIGATPDFVKKMFTHVWGILWKKRSEAFREECNQLLIGLAEILRLDESKSPSAHQPEQLKATVGDAYQDSLNFEALSEILEKTRIEGEPLPDDRRERVKQAQQLLMAYYHWFDDAAERPSDKSTFTPWEVIQTSKIAPVVGQYLAQLHNILRFFRAVHIARLEVANQYQPEKHDAMFQQFGFENLTPAELQVLPPLVLAVEANALAENDRDLIRELLNSNLPVQILLVNRHCSDPAAISQEDIGAFPWSFHLVASVLPSRQAYVFQGTGAQVHSLMVAFQKGLQQNRPALFNVLADDAVTQPGWTPYLSWAAATEARLFPTITFDPQGGTTWAEQFAITNNPSPEASWSQSTVTIHKGEGETTSQSFPFTPADYLVHDIRYSHLFQLLPDNIEDDRLIPLYEWLQLPVEKRTGKLPFLYLVDRHFTLHRVLVALSLIETVERTERFWRLLQEWGGIRSSLVERALEEARQEMEAQTQAEIDALTARYQEEMEKTVGQVAEEIVANIAAGLLGQATITPLTGEISSVSTPVKESKPDDSSAQTLPEDEVPAAETEVEEEEETLSFDEPYIETPRCTSCGECIAINNQIFAYNDNKQAFIKDPAAGPYRDLVLAAEKCPVHIIHPGKPKDPNEPHLDELIERAKPYL